MVVQSLVSSGKSVFHREAFRLKNAMSPHAAAKSEGIEIKLSDLPLPKTENTLIIELAGGIMVPLNSNELNVDLLKIWNASVVLVSQNYLGSINHTLLSLELLKNRRIPVSGIVFNGGPNPQTEEFILAYSNLNCIARIGKINELNKQVIKKIAENLDPFL